MRRAATGLGELFYLVVIDMDRMRKPNVITQPAVGLHPIHRAKLEPLKRVAFFVSGFAKVSMEFDLVLASNRGGVTQQRDRHREW